MKKDLEIKMIIAIASHYHTDKLRDGKFNLGLFGAVELVMEASEAFYKKFEKYFQNEDTDWQEVSEKNGSSDYDDLIHDWTRQYLNKHKKMKNWSI